MSSKIIRGGFWKRYNRYEAQQKGFDTVGVANFVEECLMAQPYNCNREGQGFVSGNDLEARMVKYLDQSSDGVLQDIYFAIPERKRSTELQEMIAKCLSQEFGYDQAKPGSRFTKANVYTVRPIGLKNVSLKIEKEKDRPSDTTLFQMKKEENIDLKL